MRVCILGAGSVAFGMAAFLAEAGHQPVLWSPSGKGTRALAAGAPLVARKAITGSFAVGAAASAQAAVTGADVVLIALPANGHKSVMEAAAPHLAAGQSVIVSSHASFGALYLARLLAERGLVLPIVVWGTTLVTARKTGDAEVAVTTVRQKIDVATLPESAAREGHALCTTLFGDRFVPRDGLIAIALSNLNPQNHLGIGLLNLTRMEKGEVWGQGEHVTPAVGRLIEALDLERLAIAEALGLKVRTVQEHFSLSFHVPMDSVSAMNQDMHRQGRGGFGPATADSRYVLEDVPFGLGCTALLGRLVGRPAVLHEAGIALMSAAYGRDLDALNDLIPAIGLRTMPLDRLLRLAREGCAGQPVPDRRAGSPG
jgi:opine dehydrogenase